MKNLEPCVEDRKKFDIDLEYGKVREQQVADMLQDKKIEVKSERGMWQRTSSNNQSGTCIHSSRSTEI